jgi:hypothetical protein
MDENAQPPMAINQQLAAVGLIDEWNAAAQRRDRSAMVALLKRVVPDALAEHIADRILASPEEFGL